MQENGCRGDFYIKQIKSYLGRQQFQLWSLDFVGREKKPHVCIYNMKIEAKVSMEMKGTSGRGGGRCGEGHAQSTLYTCVNMPLQSPEPHTTNIHQCLKR